MAHPLCADMEKDHTLAEKLIDKSLSEGLFSESPEPDTLLHTHNYCFSCKSTDAPKLLRCTRCKCAYYCSRECQKKDYKDVHKSMCKEVEGAEKSMNSVFERGYNEMLSFHFPLTHKSSAFEALGGWLRMRLEYAQAMHSMAYKYDTEELWKKVLGHYLEILRLDPYDYMKVRFHVPYVLLHLNLDDKAYAFCRYMVKWEMEMHETDEDEEQEVDDEFVWLNYESDEGDWIYPLKSSDPDESEIKYDRFRDFWEEPFDYELFFGLREEFALALFLIKLRLLNQYAQRLHSLKLFLSPQSPGYQISPVSSDIMEFLLGKGRLEEKRDELRSVFDDINTFLVRYPNTIVLLNRIMDSGNANFMFSFLDSFPSPHCPNLKRVFSAVRMGEDLFARIAIAPAVAALFLNAVPPIGDFDCQCYQCRDECGCPHCQARREAEDEDEFDEEDDDEEEDEEDYEDEDEEEGEEDEDDELCDCSDCREERRAEESEIESQSDDDEDEDDSDCDCSECANRHAFMETMFMASMMNHFARFSSTTDADSDEEGEDE